MKQCKWVFVPYKIGDKDIRYQLLLDDEHFGRNGNIEIILENYLQKLVEREKRRGYVI